MPDKKLLFPHPRHVVLGGPLGQSLDRAVARLAQPPYSFSWLMSDLSFEEKRQFTYFSGDVSGRFLEAASLTSPSLETLREMIAAVPGHQKPDGHFGVDVDWTDPQQILTVGTPILWGNARLLLGLITAHEQTGEAPLLEAARRLGDFYLSTADFLCDPARAAEFDINAGYAHRFDVCYFPAIESLARLYLLTRDARYLALARRMADYFRRVDTLPFPHAHGDLCSHYGLLLLHEITGQDDYLECIEKKWDAAVQGGYVWPTGGVGEHFQTDSPRDEGCAECDWLRLNLGLWAATGRTRYLDMADRLLHNGYLANQFPTGGFGHRKIGCSCQHANAFLELHEEAIWCCSFHGPLGLHLLKLYVAATDGERLLLNFPWDFSASVPVSEKMWQLTVKPGPSDAAPNLTCSVHLRPTDSADTTTCLAIRVPEWAEAVTALDALGDSVPLSRDGDYLVTPTLTGDTSLTLIYARQLRLENRHLAPIALASETTDLRDVVLRHGSAVLCAEVPDDRVTLLATRDSEGHLVLGSRRTGQFNAATVPANTASDPTSISLPLIAGGSVPAEGRSLFVFDLKLVSPDSDAARLFTTTP